MIIADVTPEGIWVNATLRLRDTPMSAEVELLIDSGLPATAVHPWQASQLAIPTETLRNATTTRLVGIGGPAVYLEIPATIEFAGVNDYGQAVAYSYPVSLHIAEPTEHNANFPAILGFDIIRHWQSVQAQAPRNRHHHPKADRLTAQDNGPWPAIPAYWAERHR